MLRHRVLAGAFADTDQLGITAHQLENRRGHQMVVENHVRLLDRLQTTKGQQPGIARPGAHQNNFSRLAFGLIQLILQRLFRLRMIARHHQAGKAAGKDAFPEAATRFGGRQTGFQMVAPVARRFRQPPEVRRQQRFNFLAQNTRQHRRFAAGGDRHQQRRTVDDRREDKRAQRLVIHHVDQPVARVSRRKHPLVKRLILRGRNHQKNIIHQRVAKFRRPPAKRLARRQIGQRRRERPGDHLHLRLSAQQEFNLAFSNLIAADHQHGPLFQFGKKGQVIHGATTLLQSAILRL